MLRPRLKTELLTAQRGPLRRLVSGLALGATIAFSPLTQATLPDPVAHWAFEELSYNGTTGEVIDSQGAHPGTASGTPTTDNTTPAWSNPSNTSGNTGRYLSVTGGGSGVLVPFAQELHPNGSFAISMWVKSNDTGTWAAPIISRGTVAAQDTRGYNIYDSNHGQWQFWTGQKGQTYDVLNTGESVSRTNWEHITVQFELQSDDLAGTLTGVKTMFINGVNAGSAIGPYSPLGGGVTSDFSIASNVSLNGLIDEVMFFDEVLDQQALNYLARLDGLYAVNALARQSGAVGNAFSYTLPTDAFVDTRGQSISYGAIGLPQGLSIDTTTGSISGTPSSSGYSTATVTATASGGDTVSQDLGFLITSATGAYTSIRHLEGLPSGRYTLNLGQGDFDVSLDDSEGGDWLLALQYHHEGGTNPSLNTIGAGSDWPVSSASALGTDLSADLNAWGHTGNAALNQIADDIELRWYGESSGNGGSVIHFRSPIGADYAKSGTGSFSGIESNFTPLSAHTGNLPAATRQFVTNQLDQALTIFPFYYSGTYHWGIRGGGTRWEVDDYPNNSSRDTVHKVWVRSASANTPPSFSGPLTDVTVDEDAPLDATLNISGFSDADTGDSLTISIANLPSWLSYNSATAQLTGSPQNQHVGVHTLIVRATDQSGAYVDAEWALTVINTNDAPTLANAMADQSATEDSAFSFQVPLATFADVDAGDSLAYTTSTLPAWLSFNSTTRTFSGTPTNGDVGSHSFSVTATDSGSATASDGFDITVANTNDAPTVDQGISQQTALADASFSFNVPGNAFNDVDAGDTLNYTLAGAPAWLSISGDTLSGTPTSADAGIASVTVQAADSSNATVSLSFDLQVTDNTIVQLVQNLPTTATALAGVGVSGAVDTREALYSAAIAAAVPAPTTASELQNLIDEVNEVADIVATAEQFNTGSSTTEDEDLAAFGVLITGVSGMPVVPDALLGELAAAIDRADPSPTMEAELIILAQALIDRASTHPVVYLEAEQGGTQVQSLQPTGGLVTLTVRIANPVSGVTPSFDWSGAGAAVLAIATEINPITDTLTLDPTTLSDGDIIEPLVTVTRNSLQASAALRLPVSIEDGRDSDGDGILDAFEGDLEASIDIATANQLQTVLGDDTRFVMEANPGTVLRLGTIARAAAANQSNIDLDDILAHSPDATSEQVIDALSAQAPHNPRQVFDFEVAALPRVGASVDVVLPLDRALLTGASYVKYHPATGWQPFEEDGLNRLASAPAVGVVLGICPPANHGAWQAGLNAGDVCLRISLEDGGPNDADRLLANGNAAPDLGLNGNIQDPGTLTYTDTGALRNPPVIKTGLKGSGSWGIELLALYLLCFGRKVLARDKRI